MWKALDAFEEYLNIQNYGSRTIEGYIRNVKFFLSFLSEKGITKVSEIEREDISEYQTYLFYFKRRNIELSPGTRATKISAVKSFFTFLVKENYLLRNPAIDLELPRVSKLLPRNTLSLKEVMQLLKAPRSDTYLGIRDRAILELLYSTGMRNTELRNLNLDDLDMRRGEVKISRGKGGVSRIVPLGEVAAHFISLYLENSRPHLAQGVHSALLFLNVLGGKLSRSALPKLVRKYAVKAKIRKKIGCHTLRHTCATHMLKGRADIRYIQELLGHRSLATTQVYTKVELTDLKKVHRECHPRNKL